MSNQLIRLTTHRANNHCEQRRHERRINLMMVTPGVVDSLFMSSQKWEWLILAPETYRIWRKHYRVYEKVFSLKYEVLVGMEKRKKHSRKRINQTGKRIKEMAEKDEMLENIDI
ncbi:hypothetical protein DINM_003099 [Dirofilaria immitis]|nr:hypothetical protein [Dirofilaria immitis]